MTTRPLMSLACSLLPLLLLAGPAGAQDTELTTAKASTCNIEGNVSLTVLGVTTNYPLPCVNPTEQSTPGIDDESLVGTQAVNLPLLNNIASADAPMGTSYVGVIPDTTAVFGQTGEAEGDFLQGLVGVDGMLSQMLCTMTEGESQPECLIYMAIGALDVGGQPVTLPSMPIPHGYQIPVSNLSLSVNVAGIPVVFSQLAGTVTLNQIDTIHHNAYHMTITHIPISVDLTGSKNVLGLGLVQIGIHARDPTRVELASQLRQLGQEVLADAVLATPLSELPGYTE